MRRCPIVILFVFTLTFALAGTLLAGQTNITVVLTNRSLVMGLLMSQSRSNIVVSAAGGQTMNLARSQISWFTLQELPASQPVAPRTVLWTPQKPLPQPVAAAPADNQQVRGGTSNSVVAEFSKPHTEDEMRDLLHTPEAGALIKSIRDLYIGSGTDAQTKAASESYFRTLRDFADGKIGIAELQGDAQDMLGELNQYGKEMKEDPQAARWNEYQQVLRQFSREPAPTSSQPAQ